MKINFTTINSIPKLKLKYDINNITGLQPLKLDSVHMEPRYQPINVLLQEIVGEYSKEDINIINKTIKTYENNPDIKNLHIAAVEEITRIFKSITDLKSISGADTKNIELFSFSPTNVSYEIKQKLKKAGITAYALNNLLHRNNIKAFQPSYDYWFNTKYKNQNSKIAQSMYQHLRDKGIFITGNLIGEEIQNVQKYEYMYNSLDINEIFNKKIKILNTLSKYLSQPESDFTGTFSNRELKIIKNNIIQYDALNNIQKKRGIFTKYLEQLLFASEMNQNIKPGNYVPGIGLITDKIFVNKKPVVIAFSTNEKYHNLKMYDLSKTTRGNEFLSTIDNISNCSELNKLNSAAKNIIDREWETVVSEIQFVPKELTENYKKYLETLCCNQDSLNILSSDTIYSIYSFINKNYKEFPSGARTIGIRLLKLLRENGGYPIYIKALAYNEKKHSPVNLYRRIGFLPMSCTNDQLDEYLKQNHGIFPYEKPLDMYMPNFDKTGERIKIFEQLYLTNTGGG